MLAAPAGVTADADQLAKQRGVIIWDEAKLLELEAPETYGPELESRLSSEDKLWERILRRHES